MRGSAPGAEWFQRENAKANREHSEALPSPVNTPRGAFIWVVIISAKPTKCLQPASPRCTRCKTGDWVFGCHLSYLSLSPPFSVYIHTLVLQTHAFIIFPYIIHKISQPLMKGFFFFFLKGVFIASPRAARGRVSKPQIQSSIYVTTNKWRRSRSVATASHHRSRRLQVGAGRSGTLLRGLPGGASLALGLPVAGRRLSPLGCQGTDSL